MPLKPEYDTFFSSLNVFQTHLECYSVWKFQNPVSLPPIGLLVNDFYDNEIHCTKCTGCLISPFVSRLSCQFDAIQPVRRQWWSSAELQMHDHSTDSIIACVDHPTERLNQPWTLKMSIRTITSNSDGILVSLYTYNSCILYVHVFIKISIK